MKKTLLIIMGVLFTLCCVVSAGADVIFEPRDSFYQTHRDQCEYHDRSYTANGPNGDVKVYESPESDTVRAVISNGDELYICYLYQDAAGTVWGCTENWQTDVTGWVPMAYLELIYDEVCFLQEYESVLTEESGALSVELAGQTVFFWEYPGSAQCYQVKIDGDYLPEYQVVYEDAYGNRWGRVGYYMAMRGWINLNDPTADYDVLCPDVSEEIRESQQETPPSEPEEEIVPKSGKDTVTVVILTGSVLAVIAVTAVLLTLLKRKK